MESIIDTAEHVAKAKEETEGKEYAVKVYTGCDHTWLRTDDTARMVDWLREMAQDIEDHGRLGMHWHASKHFGDPADGEITRKFIAEKQAAGWYEDQFPKGE